MIRTAILGYGRNGSTMHAGAIEKLPGFTMAAVCDIEAEARQKAADRFGCPVYADYREMLARGDLDLVVIVTRSSQHAPMAVDALNAGKNVMVTKPWALNEPQALEMIAAAQRNKRLLLPWLPARTACDLIRLKEIVSSGAIGRVFQIRRSEYSFGLCSDWQTLREFGGGYLLNWGPHLVDQPLQLAGSPVRSVSAHMKQLNNPGDAEDMFYAVMTTADGTIVIAEWSMAEGGLPGWLIQGDRGTIRVTGEKIEIWRVSLPAVIGEKEYRQKPVVEYSVEELDAVNEYGESTLFGDTAVMYRAAAAALAGEKPFLVPTAGALELTRVLDAIREAAQSGAAVAVS